jgi:hypothetical protein
MQPVFSGLGQRGINRYVLRDLGPAENFLFQERPGDQYRFILIRLFLPESRVLKTHAEFRQRLETRGIEKPVS